ncbi:MAG: hypothetical protein FWF82_00230 [Oscillospiraceae bacterium]|nr:hypothetical protein [Oscillospiraceae bacterium]
MKKEINLCMSCMGTVLPAEKECPHCGYTDNGVYLASYLYPKNMFANRYIVGRLISYNGESAKYMGFDTLTESKAVIKEYMPDALCSRSRGVLLIAVNNGELPLYKTYLSEFIELNRSLQSLGALQGIQRVTDVFSENNTAYSVAEYIPGVNFKTYLKNSGGYIDSSKARELFPPMFAALSRINIAGIIHRGISPKTVFYLEKDGKSGLYLTDFSITAARIYGSKINEEVFSGYAAPEQYNSLARHGDWTDVYGMSALMYTALTGIELPDAQSRLTSDILAEPILLNDKISEKMSKSIMSGLELSADIRLKTVGELAESLFGKARTGDIATSKTLTGFPVTGEGYVPPAPELDSMFDEEIENAEKALDNSKSKKENNSRFDADLVEAVEKSLRKEAWEKQRKVKTVIVISVIAAVVIFFIVLITMAVQGKLGISEGGDETTSTVSSATTTPPPETSDTSQTTKGADVNETKVTDLTYGKKAKYNSGWAADLANRFDFDFEFVAEYNSNYDKFIVFEQSIPEGQFVPSNSKITIKYSLGTEFKNLPRFEGLTVGEFYDKLKELGVEEVNIKIDDENTNYVPSMSNDVIKSCNFKFNDKIRLMSHPDDSEKKKQADVIVIVREEPPETTTTTVTYTPPPTTTTTPKVTTTVTTTTRTTTSATTTTATTRTTTKITIPSPTQTSAAPTAAVTTAPATTAEPPESSTPEVTTPDIEPIPE